MSVTSLAKSNITAINTVGLSPMPVIDANPTREGITFHNPGQSAVVVFPQFVLVNGQSVPLLPSSSALGGGFLLSYGAVLFLGGNAAKLAWQALALTGSNNPLTIEEQ